MPSNGGPVSLALTSAAQRCAALITEIERISTKEFAFRAPRDLIEVLRRQAIAVSDALSALEQDPVFQHPGTPASEQLASVQTIAAELRWIHEALALIDHIDSSRLPFEMTRCFEALVSHLLEKPARLLLRPTREYNYSLLDLEALFRKKGSRWALGEKQLETCLLLSFPSAEPDCVPLHTLFLHELAHAVWPKVAIQLMPVMTQALVDAATAHDAEITALARSSTPYAQAAPQSPLEKAIEEALIEENRKRILGAAAKSLRNWCEELYCDAIGLRLAGPAYRFAFEAFMLPLFEVLSPTSSHPDAKLRLQFMGLVWKQLEATEEGAKDLTKLFSSFPAASAALTEVPGALDLSLRIARSALDPSVGSVLVDGLIVATQQTVPTLPYGLKQYRDSLQRAIEQLDNLVPPDPLLHGHTDLSPVSIVSFVFVTIWRYRLTGFNAWKQRYGWTESARHESVLNVLALKALEASDLERRHRAGVPNA